MIASHVGSIMPLHGWPMASSFTPMVRLIKVSLVSNYLNRGRPQRNGFTFAFNVDSPEAGDPTPVWY